MKLKVIIEKGRDGYFSVHCPSLKSCWSQGKTKEEALTNIQEAIELYLEPEIEDFVDEVDRYTLRGALKDAEVEDKKFIENIK